MTKTFNVSSTGLLDPVTSDPKPICFSQQDAFTCLYDAYVDRIYRYVYFRVADDDLAENITSQVFLKAWEKLPTYQTGKSPMISWLYCIAYDVVINYGHSLETSIQFNQGNPAEISQEYDTDEKTGLQIKSQQPHESTQELADEQQQALILKFMYGFNALEMARQLEFEKQQGTIRPLQLRGLEELTEYPILLEQMYEQ